MIDWMNAIGAGIVGGLVMTAMMTLARTMGMIDANMTNYQGCVLTRRSEGARTTIAGLSMHLMFSALIAIVYAWAFAALWGRAGWLSGLAIAVVHWLVAGLALPAMDRMNHCVGEGTIRGFGPYGRNYGAMMVVGFMMGHLLYGAIVGWLYTVPGT